MQTKSIVIIGCAAVIGLGLLITVAAGGWLYYAAQDPVGMVISLEAPSSVILKEEFLLTVVIQNKKPKEDLVISSIDVADEYLSGFQMLGAEPASKSDMHVPIDNKQSYTFEQTIKPGQTGRIGFRLRALKTGLQTGEIDVCEGTRFLSTQVQTLVEEKSSKKDLR